MSSIEQMDLDKPCLDWLLPCPAGFPVRPQLLLILVACIPFSFIKLTLELTSDLVVEKGRGRNILPIRFILILKAAEE